MTTVALSPLRKQGDVSKVPTAPTVVLLQGSSAPLTATTPHTQGSSTSPTATLACTQGSGTSLRDTLAHSYTPIVHLDPLLASIKGRARALIREGGRAGLSLSPSRTLVTPTASTPTLAQDNTKPRFSPLCVPSRANPSGLGHAATIYSLVQGPPGVETPTVGALGCVLTNNFPSSSRWVVSSNLFSPGRCSVSRVSSSCHSTAATTWYSFPHSTTTTTVSPPGGGGLGDVFPPWWKSSIRACPVAFLAAGEGGGATVAKLEAAPRRPSSESSAPVPPRGTRLALTSRLR